jgi:non-ribosomal peptide synthetase component F
MAASDYGEICISGPGLARGYFRNEELTAAKFIIFEGERFYRTGDFARRTEHGLEFVGRVDSFVKNRGFLINLESQVIPLLSRCAGVQATTAFMYQDRLVAFVTPSTLDTGALRQSLASQNDSFLVPDRIRAVESLPLTPNGKIDNRALKLLLDTDSSDQDLVLNGGSKMDILRVAISIALSVSVEEICEEQSFWELGGNSLAAVKVLSLLRTRGFNLQLPALFGAGPLTAVCESIKASVAIAEESMDTRPVTGPMTTMQIKMVRRSLQNPGLGYMLLRITLPHPGFAMNEQKLQEAWRSLMQRHSIFRTTFCLADEILRVAPMVQWDWSSQEVNKDDADKLVQAHSSELRRLISQEVSGKEIAPMTAFRLVTVPNERSTLLVLAHHSQADGWSFSILLDELRALLDGRALPEAPDFIRMACEQRKLQEIKHGSDFWDNVLQAHPDPPFLTLPPPTHSKPVPDWTPSCKLDLALTPDQLDKCARRLGVTQTVMLYTAWAVVLSYYTSSDQVAFGAVFSGRNISLHGADRVVGPLINTCPFFLDFESNETVAECTSRTFARLLQMIEYQWSADVAMAGMPTDYIKNVLQTVVVMEYDLPTVTESCEAFPDPWTVEREDLLEFDISLLLEIAGGSLQGRILYDDSHYDISTMQRMLVHFKNALSCLLAPETIFMQQVYDSILTFEERQWLLESPQPEQNLYPASAAVKDAFEVAASRWPNLPALESPFGSMTYSELDLAANAVAHSVAGVTKPGDVVVVLADGSLHWAISVIAIFKAGRICCVVDKNLPRNRVEAIIEQTGASAFVAANRACAEVIQYKKSPGWFLVICDELLQSGSVQTDRLPTISKPRDTVYLVFTSGSTGIPKGISSPTILV